MIRAPWRRRRHTNQAEHGPVVAIPALSGEVVRDEQVAAAAADARDTGANEPRLTRGIVWADVMAEIEHDQRERDEATA